MSILCPNGISIPQLPTEECGGIYTSDSCIAHESSIVSLGLPANSSLETIVNTLVIALLYKEEQIQSLTARIEALEG